MVLGLGLGYGLGYVITYMTKHNWIKRRAPQKENTHLLTGSCSNSEDRKALFLNFLRLFLKHGDCLPNLPFETVALVTWLVTELAALIVTGSQSDREHTLVWTKSDETLLS